MKVGTKEQRMARWKGGREEGRKAVKQGSQGRNNESRKKGTTGGKMDGRKAVKEDSQARQSRKEQ